MEYKYRRAIDLFKEIVKIDSPSTLEQEMANYIANYAKEKWGIEALLCEADLSKLPAENVARLTDEEKKRKPIQVVVEIPATEEGHKTLLFCSHIDTVMPGNGIVPVEGEDGIITSEGETILASDDKAGVAAILSAVDVLMEEKRPHGKIVCAFTVCEERGLLGARLLDVKRFGADYGFVFDAMESVGRVIERVQHTQTFKIELKVSDIPSHSKAITVPNALTIACDLVCRLPKGLWSEDDVTVSAITGLKTEKEAGYMVPNKAVISGSIRSFLPGELKLLRLMFDKILSEAKYNNTEITWKFTPEQTLGYDQRDTKEGKFLIKKANEALKAIGIKPIADRTSMGGHDASIFRREGLPTLVLSCGMMEVHSTREWIKAQDISDTTALILELINRF